MNGSTEEGTALPCNVSNLSENTIVVYATDSRGQTGSATITLSPWVDYIRPTISIGEMERASITTATSTVTISLSGTATLNSVLSSTYTIQVGNGSTTASKTLSTSRTDVHWEDTLQLGNIAREQSYTITATINDGFEQYTATAKLKRAFPVIHMGNDFNNEGIPHFDVEGHLVIHGSDAKIIWVDDDGQTWEMTLTKFKSLL